MSHRTLSTRPHLHSDSIWSVNWAGPNQLVTAGVAANIKCWQIQEAADTESASDSASDSSSAPNFSSSLSHPVAEFGSASYLSCISTCPSLAQNQIWSSWMDGKLRLFATPRDSASTAAAASASSASSSGGELLSFDCGGSGRNWSIAHHKTRNLIATGSTVGLITLIDYAACLNQPDSVSATDRGSSAGRVSISSPDCSVVHSVSFSPDGSSLASGLADGSVLLIDVETGKILSKLAGHSMPVRALTFACDSPNSLFSGSDDSFINNFDTRNYQQLNHIQAHQGWVTSLNASDSTLLSTGSDRKMNVWSMKTGGGSGSLELSHSFECDGIVWDSAIHRNGKIACAASDDGGLKIVQIK